MVNTDSPVPASTEAAVPVAADGLRPFSTLAPTEASPLPQRLAYSLNEAAQVLGVAPVTVRRLLSRGLLKSSKALRHKLIPVREIERFLAETL